MDLIFQPNLQRMALHATALMFWNQTDVQKKLRCFLLPYKRTGIQAYLKKLTKEVIKKINRESLPNFLYRELVLIVGDLGFKMYDWFRFLKRSKVFRDENRSQVYSKLFKTIYWTHYGSVNEKEILKHFWLGNSTVDLRKVYMMACCYCLVDVIEDLWKKISEDKPLYNYKDLCKRYGFHLVAYWNKLRENDLETFINDVIVPNNLYDTSKSVEVNMLKLSVRKGYVPAVKYFWGKISQREKDENVVFLLNDACDCFNRKISFEIFREEQYTEITMFFMSFLSESGKNKAFTDSLQELMDLCYDGKYAECHLSTAFKMIHCKWPWDEFLQILFIELRDFFTIEIYRKLIEAAKSEINKSSKLNIPINQSPAQRRQHQIWLSTPVSLRGELCGQLFKYGTILFDCADICSIKLMVNDKHVAYKKPEILKMLIPWLMDLVEEGKNEVFFELVKELYVSTEWYENVQSHLKLMYQLILEGNFEAADDILACYSNQDTAYILKNEMDEELMCHYFIEKNQYDTAEKFLQWKFDGDLTEMKRIKDNFKEYFIINHIGKTWKGNDISIAKINSENFLLWLFGSEIKVLSFKQKSLLSKILNCEEETFSGRKSILREDRLEILEDFLNWCSLYTSGNMKMLKKLATKQMSQKYGCPLVTYMRNNDVKKMEKFLTYWFDSEDEKIDFMNDFLLSYNGLSSCKFYISVHINPGPFEPKMEPLKLAQKFKEFIDFFIKPYLKNFDLFKKKLGEPEDSMTVGRNNRTSESFNTDATLSENWGACFDIDEYKLFLNVLSSAEQEKNS